MSYFHSLKENQKAENIKPCFSGYKTIKVETWDCTWLCLIKCSSPDSPSSPVSSGSYSLSLRPVVLLKQREKLVKWKQKGTRSSWSRLEHQACHQVSVCPWASHLTPQTTLKLDSTSLKALPTPDGNKDYFHCHVAWGISRGSQSPLHLPISCTQA